MKVLATPRSFGKNNPELFDILRDAGLDVVRNDTGGILSAALMCEKLADCDGLIVGVDPVDAAVLAAAPRLRAIAKYGVWLQMVSSFPFQRIFMSSLNVTLGHPTQGSKNG